MPSRIRALVLSASLLMAGACLPGGTMDNPFSGAGGGAHCEIVNNYRADIRVAALTSVDGERLGTVISQTRETFELPRAWVEDGVPIAIQVQAIGGRGRYTTEDYVLEPGSVMQVTIQNRLGHSSVTIR